MSTADERAHLRLTLAALAGLLGAGLALPLAVVVRDRWIPLRDADVRWLRSVDLAHGPARDAVLGVTQLGAPLVLEVLAVVGAVVLVRRGRRRSGAYVAVSVLGAEALSTLSKHVTSRVRPCIDLAGCPHSTSFPSGHSVGAAAFWTTMAVLLLPRLGRRAFALALVAPLVVGATRLLLGVHYPSDVAAGLLLGWAWAIAATAVFAAWRDERAGRDVPLEGGLD